jgi:hypothetical protein
MSFTYKNLDGQTTTEKGNSMGATDLMGVPSITGGAAAPSQASALGSTSYVSMNNPFSVAGQGGTANATASTSQLNTTTLLILAAIAGVVLIGLK